MSITLDSELEAVLAIAAQESGVSMEELVRDALRERFAVKRSFVPRDDWERELAMASIDCGVSPPDHAISSEGLYE